MEDGTSFILRCKNGDVEAFRGFFHLYQRYVYSLCLGFIHDEEEALDLCQEVFLRVFRNIKRFDQRFPVKPWLRKIAVNACINFMKTRARSLGLQSSGRLDDLEGFAETGSTDRQNDPFIYAQTNEEMDAVRLALKTLKPDERMAIVLRHQEGLEYDEICKLTGWPLGTLKSLLFRARRSLREKLAGKTAFGETGVNSI